MAIKVLFLRGSAAQNDAYMGNSGELTIDLTNQRLRLHDGITAGGVEIGGTKAVSDALTALEGRVATNELDIGTINDLVAAIQLDMADKVDTSEVGVSIATLDGNGKIPLTQINDAVLGQVEYSGTWDATANLPALPATPDVKGLYYVVSTAGNFAGLDFQVGDWIISNGTEWQKVDNTDAVSTVAGQTGNVVLAKSDVGLDQVDNTSDAAKPVSTAQQTALDTKAPLASPTFTGAPKAPTPLDTDNTTAIATTAFVVSKLTAVDTGVASITGNAPITIGGNAANPSIGITNATPTQNGAMSSEDKTKLDTVAVNAQENTVDSVSGKTGAVTLNKADVGLDQVSNYPTANQVTMEALDSTAHYVTPAGVRQFLNHMGISEDVGGGWIIDEGLLPDVV